MARGLSTCKMYCVIHIYKYIPMAIDNVMAVSRARLLAMANMHTHGRAGRQAGNEQSRQKKHYIGNIEERKEREIYS